MNLFDNELKHLPGPCAVSIHLVQQPDGLVVLTLRDQGNGFDPEVRSQLFTRRVKGRNSNGHGLGLAFVDAVVRAHGGKVTASNHESGGAQITIMLPAAASTVVPLQAAQA